MKKLYKSRYDVKVDGVCGGIAEYLGVDSTIVRLVFLVVGIQGYGILAYIICSCLMPRAPRTDDPRYYGPQQPNPHGNQDNSDDDYIDYRNQL